MKILEQEPPLADECKVPWIIDAFLYPISAAGMINLAVFVFLPLIISFFVRLLAIFLQPILQLGTGYILAFLTAPFYFVFFGYVFYYIVHCVVDSTKGNRRATDIIMPSNFDFWDLLSQVILLLGCVAICLWPVAIYYLLTRQKDLWFWLLSVGGFIMLILPSLELWSFLAEGIKFYLIFVLTHRLGWFYWWHKDKLDWGI